MVALAWTPSIPQRTVDEKPKHLPESKVVETTSVGEDKKAKAEVAKQERLIFADNADSLIRTTTATATEKPVAEPAQAYAISSTPLFDFIKSGGENMVAVVALFNLNGKATAGGLTKPENNSGSGDKKQGGNTFLSQNKTLDDLRAERLEQEHEHVFIA